MTSSKRTGSRTVRHLRRPLLIIAIVGVLLGALWAVGRFNAAPSEPEVAGGPTTMRRLTEAQYKRSIAHIFGPEIEVPGRFDPPLRQHLLIAIGNSNATVSEAGTEQALARARAIAEQVLASERRGDFLDCSGEPASVDSECAAQFLQEYGRLIYRRPLVDDELAALLRIVGEAAATSSDFYTGLEYGLTALLVSPSFLFRIEEAAAGDGPTGELDPYSVASRISFLLWDAPPDDELLDAAGRGDLSSRAGIDRQVSRLMDSPKFEAGARAFFWDMFGYNLFSGLVKDGDIFPRFSPQLRMDAEEQTMRTVINLLIHERGDYRDLFTTRATFLNRNLGSLLGVPVDERAFDGWMPYTFKEDERRAGILTLPAFLMQDPNHEGQSSPTIRGKMVRELFLCHEVPPPPGDVNFDIAEDPNRPMRTARERLAVHNEEAVCAGCHAVTDPIGLAYENYDAIGQFRLVENGVTIDPTGDFEGEPFEDAIAMQEKMVASGAIASCLTKKVYEYGVGRSVQSDELRWLSHANAQFAQAGYRFVDLIRMVATSKAFRAVSLVE